MEIACPHCGLLRTVADDLRSSGEPTEPCPRCAERAQLFGAAEAALESGTTELVRRGDWHVVLRGLQRGPYTLTALRRLLAQAGDAADASVWRQGMTSWVPARDLELLARDTEPAPQAVAPVPAQLPSLPLANTVQRARVHIVSGVGLPADPRVATAAAPSSVLCAASESTAPAVVSAPPEGAAVADLAAGALPESFREAALTLRPPSTHAPRPRSRAAGEITLTIPALREASHGASLRWFALACLAVLALAGGWSWRARHGAPGRVPPPPPLSASHMTPAQRSAPALPVPDPVAVGAAARPAEPPLARPPAAEPAPGPVAAGAAASAAEPPLPRPRAAEPVPEPQLDPNAAPRLAINSVRIASAWAPIRVAAAADASVICSLPRGTQLSVLAQRRGHRGRWFEVRCDAARQGWVHQNHLRALAR